MCYYSSFVKFNDSYKTLLGLNKYFYNNVSISKLDIINKECCDLLLSDLKKEVTKKDIDKVNFIVDSFPIIIQHLNPKAKVKMKAVKIVLI